MNVLPGGSVSQIIVTVSIKAGLLIGRRSCFGPEITHPSQDFSARKSFQHGLDAFTVTRPAEQVIAAFTLLIGNGLAGRFG